MRSICTAAENCPQARNGVKIRVWVQTPVKPANSEVVDTEQVLCVSPARNHMESEPGFGFREKSMKR